MKYKSLLFWFLKKDVCVGFYATYSVSLYDRNYTYSLFVFEKNEVIFLQVSL